jgi:uncharacterized protein YyaL (SSP411 family)
VPPSGNRLADASSPYLLQHAGNPVDWYPWGDEAFEAARRQDKPIFLSVGYSSCHWCHVMEHESFADDETAALMNDLFVNIKVDREELPDVDDIYMQAVQLFSGGHGGWPMSVFLTPSLEPFFAGTYFPPTERGGMPSFRRVLQAASEAWRERRDNVFETSGQVVRALQQMTALQPSTEMPGRDLLDTTFGLLQSSYDPEHGGFGGAPRFPRPMDLGFLLRYAKRTGVDDAHRMVSHTLHRMSRGGIFDQLGGGLHRYSTDARWLVPHFEKMLYDNALLVRVCVEAWQVGQDDALRHVAEHVLTYVEHELSDPAGGFWSAQDADSEGVEGRYFVWTAQEIRSVLPDDLARLALRYWDVTDSGNFEDGTTILSVPRDDDVVASELGLSWDRFHHQLEETRQRLLEHRRTRVAPATDDKIITAWNGLMISALVRAYQAWRQPAWLQRAERAATFIVEQSRDGLFRTWRRGRAQGRAYLDDHAAWIAACIDLFEATFDTHWLDQALQHNDIVESDFGDAESGGYLLSSRKHQSLIAAPRSFLDNAVPSGNSLQLSNLQRLAHLTGRQALHDRAQRLLQAHASVLRQYPTAMAEMLCGVDFHLGPVLEVVVSATEPQRELLCAEVFAAFHPNKVVAGWPVDPRQAARLDLLQARQPQPGEDAVFVCRQQVCQAPVHLPEEVRAALERAQQG